MAKRWTCVTVEVGASVVDELSSEVAALLQCGVELTDTGFRVYLDESLAVDEWRPLLESAIRSVEGRSASPFPRPTFVVSSIPEEDWGANWKAHFKPLRVGKRLLVCPTWEDPEPAEADLVLRIDPGRAFGTGHHETTRLCLEWLEEFGDQSLKHGSSPALLDVGTGSGILAMAGILLGFRRALGIDNDPEAIDVATENVRTNGLDGKIRLIAGDVGQIAERFDVVIANIQADPLVSLADALIAHTGFGGRLVLSGILVNQDEMIRQAYESKGMTLLDLKTDGEWCLLVFTSL